MQPSGHILFQDEFQQNYYVEWVTTDGVIDFTSTVGQPYVWGEEDTGFIKEGVLFRRGIVTITRQVIRPFQGGYEIVAEGVSQFEDDIQMNFPCQVGPADPFKFHLDYPIVDQVLTVVTDGPRWADPDEDIDYNMVWGDLDVNGDPMVVSGTVLEFIDVWG